MFRPKAQTQSLIGRVGPHVWRREEPPICESLMDWATDNQLAIQRLQPATEVSRTPVTTDDPMLDAYFRQYATSYDVPAKYLVRLPGAMLTGADGLVVLPDGRFAAESIYDATHLVGHPAYRTPSRRRMIDKPGEYYSLVIEYATEGNYYHWVHDAILRLHGILEHLPPETQFVVPTGLTRNQAALLHLVGVDPERVVEFDGAQSWRLESLWFSPTSSGSGVDSPAADRWLRDTALDAYSITPAGADRKIYISRKRAEYRRIVNESDVVDLLTDRGFEVHHPEAYTIRDQVALFAEAAVVVAAHGAGFTNILFAPPGLTVVEIFEPSRLSKCYWSMCAALDHQYWCMCGSSAPSDTSYAENIWVPLNRLESILQQAGVAQA